MMHILPSETSLVGQWLFKDGHVTTDEMCRRIESLIENYLDELGRDTTGWDVLYRDPKDRRLWELTYPLSDMHGGGPPQLTLVSFEQVSAKYPNLQIDAHRMGDRP
jgi:hypothetical protein